MIKEQHLKIINSLLRKSNELPYLTNSINDEYWLNLVINRKFSSWIRHLNDINFLEHFKFEFDYYFGNLWLNTSFNHSNFNIQLNVNFLNVKNIKINTYNLSIDFLVECNYKILISDNEKDLYISVNEFCFNNPKELIQEIFNQHINNFKRQEDDTHMTKERFLEKNFSKNYNNGVLSFTPEEINREVVILLQELTKLKD